jgi:hypothetical protein
VRSALLLLLGACQFEHGIATRTTDAAPPDVDAAPDALVAPFCDATDTSLIACYELDGNVNDASANMLNAQTTSVTFTAGHRGMAMQFGATSAADVADSAAFDVTAITIEAWINPSELPTTGLRMGILDVNGQYGFFLHETGQLRCVASAAAQVPANVPINAWTHVACTYEPPVVTIYVNGAPLASVAGGGALPMGLNGMSIAGDNPSGSRLIGLIDDVRLWSRARTANEICVDAGACQPVVR